MSVLDSCGKVVKVIVVLAWPCCFALVIEEDHNYYITVINVSGWPRACVYMYVCPLLCLIRSCLLFVNHRCSIVAM